MKTLTNGFYLAGLFILITLIGCAVQPGVPKGQGSVEVRIGRQTGNPSQRGILAPEHSSLLANGYEVFAYQQDGNGSWSIAGTATLGASGSTILSLDPGDYRISVLAGLRRSETSKTALLLGSGSTDSPVTIVSGARTLTLITLKAIDLSFTVPETGEWGSQVVVQAAGNSRNPEVGMSLSGASSYDSPRVKSTALWDGYQTFSPALGSPNQWTTELSITLPSTLYQADIQFFGGSVILLPEHSSAPSLSITDSAMFTWKWLNRLDMTDDSPLVSLVFRTLAITPPTTGLEVELEWE